MNAREPHLHAPYLGPDPRVRALALWPRLDRRKLTRTCGDPDRVARLVEHRTALSHDAIVVLLVGTRRSES